MNVSTFINNSAITSKCLRETLLYQIYISKRLLLFLWAPLTTPKWVANVVMVKKPNGKWCICIDYKDLNKACPKDRFPISRIEQLVDATTGHELISFMDTYLGYNQIRMHEPD